MRASGGLQFAIGLDTAQGRAEAVITQVAAALRGYSVGGIEVTESFPETSIPPFGTGIVLVPWPNRVEDGTWMLDGVQQQLSITEPPRHNAIHGLLRWMPYSVVEHTASALTLAATVFPQSGYPFQLDTTVRYALSETGLTVTHALTNVSERRAPVAIGTHTFLTIGDVPPEELVLTLAASTHFELDARLIPRTELPVEGTPFDLRAGKRLGDLFLDDAFGGVEVVDGASRHRLTAPDGRYVELWQDENFGYVQVFTTELYPKNGATKLAVAVEPMTAPANALNTGQGLRWLEPGEVFTASWGIHFEAAGRE
jgi:aldose 1-epimerase